MLGMFVEAVETRQSQDGQTGNHVRIRHPPQPIGKAGSSGLMWSRSPVVFSTGIEGTVLVTGSNLAIEGLRSALSVSDVRSRSQNSKPLGQMPSSSVQGFLVSPIFRHRLCDWSLCHPTVNTPPFPICQDAVNRIFWNLPDLQTPECRRPWLLSQVIVGAVQGRVESGFGLRLRIGRSSWTVGRQWH